MFTTLFRIIKYGFQSFVRNGWLSTVTILVIILAGIGGIFWIFSSGLDGSFFATLNFNPPTGGQFFRPIEDFVLFGTSNIILNQETQILRGNIGANNNLVINKDSLITGDLFGKRIVLGPGVIVSGNVFARKLNVQQAQILGDTSIDITFPIAKIPEIPDFSIGAQDFSFRGENNVLNPGSYRNIALEKDSRLILPGGTYNLNKLELKDNSSLIFSAPSTLNIQFKFRSHDNVKIYPDDNSLFPQDLTINYAGFPKPETAPNNFLQKFFRFFFKSKPQSEDDDKKVESLLEPTDLALFKKGKLARPILIGKNSVPTFKLIAPEAIVIIGQDSLIRGNIWSKSILLGKQAAVRDTIWFSIPSSPADIITEDTSRFYSNIVEVDFLGSSDQEDAERIALFLNAKIVGFAPSPSSLLIAFQISSRTKEELDAAIASVDSLNDPEIEAVFPAFLLELD